jgi:hypothetical protein
MSLGALFDLAEARAARDKAIAQAVENAPDEWLAQANRAVLSVAWRLHEFTADDIWATGLPQPREPRALGGVLKALAKSGVIAKTGRFQSTARVRRHAAPVAIWRSLVCREGRP